jgi:hypothetical protein
MTRALTIRHLLTEATRLDIARGTAPKGQPVCLGFVTHDWALTLASALEEAAEQLARLPEWEEEDERES